MAWGNSLSVETVQEDSRSVPTLAWTPFDASKYEPMIKPVPTLTVGNLSEAVAQAEKTPEQQRERDREEVKVHLQGILRNRLLSESARVAAARELTRIFDNEELDELRSEVKRLTALVEANAPDESALPPHLRSRR